MKWKGTESFPKPKAASNLPVVNDVTERALGLATTTNIAKTAPTDEKELQALYKVIRGVREKLSAVTSSMETITKNSLAAVKYSWN